MNTKKRNAGRAHKAVILFRSPRLVLAVFCLLTLSAHANDGTYYTSGNQLIPLQETDISVHKETLTISLMDNGYARVDVYYEFWNPGKKAKRVLMGFEAIPPYNDDYQLHNDGIHPYIEHFTVLFNGTALPYRNAPCMAGKTILTPIDTAKQYYVFDDNRLFPKGKGPWYDDEGTDGIDYVYVYYFNADFQPGLNRVRHTYTYKMDVSVAYPYGVSYRLTPAARWANRQIDDFTLILRADSTAKHFFIPDEVFGGKTFSLTQGMGKTRKTSRGIYMGLWQEFSLRNGAMQIHLTNFKPQKEFTLEGVGPDDCIDSNDRYHFGGTYDRSSALGLYFDNGHTVPDDREFRLRIAHNLPYANRGHVFKDPRLRQFFESLWWYMPDPDYNDDTSSFTDVDRLYITSGL